MHQFALSAISFSVAGILWGTNNQAHAAENTEPGLEEILVSGHARKSYLSERSSVGILTEELVNIPQSITTITEAMLNDRGAASLDDALRNVPGITLGAGEFSWQGNNPNIRGFSARNDMFVDGIRDLGHYARDPFYLESVEVLQGPSSMVFGRGSTGGVVNQNTKTPAQNPLRSLHVNIGNADTRRMVVDINQPLSKEHEAAFRLNLLMHEADVPERDGAETRRWGFAPSLALNLGGATRLTLSYMKMKSDSIPDYGLPWIDGKPADVDRSNFYGFPDDKLDVEADIGTAILHHRINDAFSIDAKIRYAEYSRSSRITEPQVDPSVSHTTPAEDVTVTRLMFSGESREKVLGGQLNLRLDFTTGTVEHALVGGLDLSRETSDPTFGFAGQTPFFDYQLPVPDTNLANPGGTFTGATATRLRADAESETLAAFLLDTISISSQWELVLGARWDRFKTDYFEQRYDVSGNPTRNASYPADDTEISYRTALVYHPTQDSSIYFAWGTSFNPSSEAVSFISSGRNLSTSNVFLDPEENESFELGSKWAVLDERLRVDTALFYILKNNARVPDPQVPGANILAGEQRVLGISANVTGNLSEALSVSTGYTWLDSEQTSTTNESIPDGARLTNVAEHSFNIWVNATVTDNIEVGGGGRYVGDRLATNSLPRKTVDDYWVIDAMAQYHVNENLSFKFNITNLTNQNYVDQIHPWHIIPGHGISTVFAVNLDY